MPARLLVGLLLLLVAIPLLSGCGGSDTISADAIAKAADATVAKGGAKIAIQSQVDQTGTGPLTLSGDGAIDSKTRTGHLVLHVTDAPSLPAAVDKAKLGQELVFDHFVFYLRSPSFAGALKSGKRWIKLDLAKAGKAAGIDFSLLSQARQDPSQSLRLLKAVSGDVKKVGDEDVRGVNTTHYKATVDLAKYPGTLPAKDRAAAQLTVDNLVKRLGSTKSPVEVWIGKDHLVRRYVQTLKLKLAGRASSIKQRIEFYDYGTKVDVVVPSADEVQDLTGIAASGLRETP